MIVCSCFGITDREIRDAFGPGGDGQCPAGQGCGACTPHVHEITSRNGPEQPDADRHDPAALEPSRG